MSRVLILKFGAIGDALMVVPAAHALHLQGHTIDWVCGPTVAPLLALYPFINIIVADDRAILRGSPAVRTLAILKLWRTLARNSYHLCATLYYDSRYKILAIPIRASRKIMLSRTDREFTLIDGRHHTDEYARILTGRKDTVTPSHLSPIAPQDLPPSPLPRTAHKKRIAIAPAGARNLMSDDALRRWPAENYVALTRHLLAANFEVVLTGGPDDHWITPHFAALPVTNLIGELSLPQLAAVYQDSDAVITHDTGSLHIAGITATPLISIFGPVDPAGRNPRRPGATSIWGGEGFACRPCYDGRNYAPCDNNLCMAQVTPAMVFAQVEIALAEVANAPISPDRILVPSQLIQITEGPSR